MENQLLSKRVNFTVSPNSLPERVNISNAWVVKILTIKQKKMNPKRHSSKVSLSSRHHNRHSDAITDININSSLSTPSTFV